MFKRKLKDMYYYKHNHVVFQNFLCIVLTATSIQCFHPLTGFQKLTDCAALALIVFETSEAQGNNERGNEIFNCSQTKFSNYISPVALFNAIYRLTDFSSGPFDFSSSKTG